MMKLTKSSRAFRRATAFILAAAMTLSAPVATQASAASKKKVPSLSVKKKTLYYNQAGKKSFTLKVKKNKVKKIVKTKWTTSKKSVVGISAKKKTKVKVTAKKKGTAKITAKVTYRLKAGSKAKTKKLVCKVTSKKKSSVVTPAPATQTPATSGTPATDVPATDVPATDVPATDVPATDVPATETPVASETPSAIVAEVESISSIDSSDFAVMLTFKNPAGEVTDNVLNGTKLEMKKGDITVSAAFEKVDEKGAAIYKIEDSKALRPGNRDADGEYTVTTTSASIKLPSDAITTYEEALAGMAVEGYVTRWNTDVWPNAYTPVQNAVITIKGGKTATTDSTGYYRIATTAGRKTMSIEASTSTKADTDYISQTTSTGAVAINRNHSTAQNFVLAKYDPKKVILTVEAVNKENDLTKVQDATVKLKDASGNAVYSGELKTDATGKAEIANVDATTTLSGSNLKKGGWPNPDLYLERGKTYTLEVEKALKKGNLHDVYKVATKQVTIGGTHENKVTIELEKVKEIDSFTISQKYEDGTTEYSGGSAYYTYELYTDLDNDKTADELMAAPEKLSGTLNSDHIAKGDGFIDALKTTAGSSNKATLPTGTYFVVIKNYAESACTNPTTSAYAVAKVDVTEGGKAAATVTIKKGWVRKVNTALGLRPEELSVQPTAAPSGPYPATGSALNSIIKAGDPVANTATATAVKTKNVLYQIVGDVLVKVDDNGDGAGYIYVPAEEAGKAGTYLANNQYAHLLDGESYTIKSASDYTYGDAKSFSVDTETNTVQIDTEARWNLTTVKVKVQTGDAVIGNAAPQIVKIRVLDKDGNEKYVSANTVNATSVEAGTTAAVGAGYITYDMSTAVPYNALRLMKRGQYKVEVTLKDCKAVTSGVTTNVGLEDVTATCDEKLQPASDKTKITGVIRVRDDKDNVTRVANGNAQVILLDAAGKIAGASTTTSGEYSIIDHVSNAGYARLGAGTYTMVVRCTNAETYATSVTLENEKTLTYNVEMQAGATGLIKATVTNGNLNKINGLHVNALDSFYKDPAKGNMWTANRSDADIAAAAATLAGNAALHGKYAAGADSYYVEFTATGLSVGSYTLTFSDDDNVYNFTNKEVVITDLGGEKYPVYRFDPKQEGAGKSRLTIVHNNLNTTASGLDASAHNYVVVAKRQDGTTEDIAYLGNMKKQDSLTETTLNVTTGQAYNVYVYDFGGHYIAQASNVVVQDVRRTITVALENAAVD